MAKKKSGGTGCLVLFALPFAAVGVGVVGYACFLAFQSLAASNWVEVPATINTAILNVNRGDDSTTYSVSATYTYSYEGQSYSGDRVSFDDSGDNLGSYHEDIYAILKDKRGQVYRCYVDPDDPWEAVLFPELRIVKFMFLLLFGLVFGAVGFGLLGAGLWSVRREKENEALAVQNPDAPWRWNKDWSNGFIQGGGKGAAIATGFFALIWNGISAPLLFIIPGEVLEKANYIALVGLLFPAIGALLIGMTLYLFLRYRKYGATTVEMITMPGVIGGDLRALVHVPTRIVAEEPIQVQLSCLKVRVTGSGKNRRTSRSILWQDAYGVPASAVAETGGETAIPVRFRIPYDQPETFDNPGTDNGDIEWKLEVEAKTPGIDFKSEFLLPVFKTPESSPEVMSGERDEETFGIASETVVDPRVVQVQQLVDGGHEFYYPPARLWGSTLFFIPMGLVFGGAGVFMIYASDAPLFMGIIFAAVGGLIVLGGMHLLTARIRVTINRYGVRLRSGVPFLTRTRAFGHAAVQEINVANGMSVNDKQYYNIMLRLADGKTLKAGSLIPSRRMADAIVEEMVGAMSGSRE